MDHSDRQTHTPRAERIPVDIAVTVSSVLTGPEEATLRDLTECGALVEGMPLPKGAQFQIDYEGQTVYGVVTWSEQDRFGARFPFPLMEGPLLTRLEQARIEHAMGRRETAMPVPSAGARMTTGFGRRGLN